MAQKVEFLQGKGLSDTEIQQALSEAAGGSSNPSAAIQSPAPAAPPAYARPAPSYQQAQPHYGFQAAVIAPEPPKRDWRDIFVSGPKARSLSIATRAIEQLIDVHSMVS